MPYKTHIEYHRAPAQLPSVPMC